MLSFKLFFVEIWVFAILEISTNILRNGLDSFIVLRMNLSIALRKIHNVRRMFSRYFELGNTTFNKIFYFILLLSFELWFLFFNSFDAGDASIMIFNFWKLQGLRGHVTDFTLSPFMVDSYFFDNGNCSGVSFWANIPFSYLSAVDMGMIITIYCSKLRFFIDYLILRFNCLK